MPTPETPAGARAAGDTIAIDGPSVASATAAAALLRLRLRLRADRDTVTVDGPAEPPPGDAGIGGLFGRAEQDDAPGPDVAPGPPRTAVLPAQQPPAPVTPPVPAAADPAQQHFWDRAPEHDDPGGEERPGRTRRILLVVAAVLVLALIGVGLALMLGDRDGDGATAAPTDDRRQTVPSGPRSAACSRSRRVSYTVRAAAGRRHLRGQRLRRHRRLLRRRPTAPGCPGRSTRPQVDGRAVVVSVARVRMPDTAAARELQALTDRNGSGNVSDLLREGVTLHRAAPQELSGAEYASAVSGPTVTIVESAWVDRRPPAAAADAEVDQVAAERRLSPCRVTGPSRA